jgi:transketolase
VAEQLGAEGLDVGVVSVACIKPLDTRFVQEVAQGAQLIATLEEHVLRGGLYAAVAAVLAGLPRHPPVLGFGTPDQMNEMSLAGNRDALLAAAGLSPPAIVARVKSAMAGGS